MSCEKYYEDYLGNCCDNDCANCAGNKEWVYAKSTFSITKDTIIEKEIIKKNTRFWIKKELPDGRKMLLNKKAVEEGRIYSFKKEFFDEHFKYYK